MAQLTIYPNTSNYEAEGYIETDVFNSVWDNVYNIARRNSDDSVIAEAHWRFNTDDSSTGLAGATINSVTFKAKCASVTFDETCSVWTGSMNEDITGSDFGSPSTEVSGGMYWSDADTWAETSDIKTDFESCRSGFMGMRLRVPNLGQEINFYSAYWFLGEEPRLVVDYTPAPTFVPQITIL